jgi:phosphomethylpyrimidine synthase
MCGPKFCSMKISQEVREFAKLQNQDAEGFIASDSPLPVRGGVGGGAASSSAPSGQPHPNPSPEGEGLIDAEAGMEAMSELFKEIGSELYMGQGDREHD